MSLDEICEALRQIQNIVPKKNFYSTFAIGRRKQSKARRKQCDKLYRSLLAMHRTKQFSVSLRINALKLEAIINNDHTNSHIYEQKVIGLGIESCLSIPRVKSAEVKVDTHTESLKAKRMDKSILYTAGWSLHSEDDEA